jgi:phosphatidylinositol alpha-1,6-mannosyltransferase
MPEKILLLSLQTFSTTGGIQKMTRVLAHSLYNIAQSKEWNFSLYAAYDANENLMAQYIPTDNFKGFSSNKRAFTINAVLRGIRSDVVILSHVNLAIVGLLIKLVNPTCKIWLVAHGIEVWRPFGLLKGWLLKVCNKVICVSNYTRQQIVDIHSADPAKCVVLNNALDPFMKVPAAFNKPQHLLSKYHLTTSDPVIFTLTRLASTEQYKGYEQVITAVGRLKAKFPKLKYILSGEYDALEKIRIDEIIKVNDAVNAVILTGFLADDELTDHFLLADVFVLPSRKEGFGIVFIEALACGLPVICGNADGSIDAIKNGALGIAVDVNNIAELETSIDKMLNEPVPNDKRSLLQQQCMAFFNEEKYRFELQEMLIAG